MKSILTYTSFKIYFFSIIFIIIATPSFAYLGPGVGAGVIAATIGVIVAIFAALFGLIWFQIKKDRLKKKKINKID